MIEHHAGRQQLVCDCGTAQPDTYARDEFDVMISDAKEAGWIIARIAGEWCHSCADCVEAARPRPGQSRRLL